MGSKFLTEADVSALIIDYKAGMKIADIAKKYKTCMSYPPILVRRRNCVGRQVRLTTEEFLKIESDLLDSYYSGMLLKQLCHKFSVGRNRIYCLLRKRGMKLRTKLGKG